MRGLLCDNVEPSPGRVHSRSQEKIGVQGEKLWVPTVVLELITYVTSDIFLTFLSLDSLNHGLTRKRVVEDDVKSSCSEA